jgi:hypothetical protein
MADELFLLRPDFFDPAAGPGRYYCPGCAAIAGLLSYYPELRERLVVREVDFPRPRAEVAAVLGPDHPGCPVLVLDPDNSPKDGLPVQLASNGRLYVLGANNIGQYLAAVHGVGSPHP